ncbi:MAG: efflux RND transporter periplasmic adaptor subunit [Lachnospiraceae bacterium]|jgi:RND family efflux transporter MFP subunit|nr:efflux RND transporter periplasmic adaptor subunit [Lachnospiraceae bacterium]
MTMRKKVIVAGICGAALAAAVGGYFLLEGNRQAKGGMKGAGGAPGGMTQEASVTVVKASVPSKGDLSLSTGLTGTVEAADVVYVYAKTTGDVTAVHVKAGDVVTAGQVLCEIDTEQVDSARNSMEAAQVSLAQAQSNLDRMQLLYSSGDLSEQEYEQYSNSVKSSRLQYESAKLAYERQVEYSRITAPIGGRIESCDVEIYDRVNQSGQLCVISGEGESRITFFVTQRMMKNIREGDVVEVEKNGETYQGRISEISSMVDESSGLFKVKAELNHTEEIPIGSTVKLNLVTERAENAMLVPVDAIYYSGGDGYVYLYQDGTAKMTPVEVGLYDSEYAQILSGLNETDMVVSTWSSNLYEGAKIRLKGEEGQKNVSGGGELRDSGERGDQGEKPEGGVKSDGPGAGKRRPEA